MMHRPQHTFLVSIFVIALVGIGVFVYFDIAGHNSDRGAVTATAEYGTVEQIVSVSGVVRSDTTGRLGFPVNGTIASIAVQDGDEVAAGDRLASLNTTAIDHELNEARATLQEAIANQREVLAGPTSEARTVIETNVAIAEEELERTIAEQTQAVQNARRTLLSTDLAATPEDEEEEMPAPTIDGTYRCEAEGTYRFEVFRSNADSNYSIRVTGLETDTVPVSFTQAVPFGNCGLRAQFAENTSYANTVWFVAVPNTASDKYTSNQNAYDQAALTAENKITAAEEALALATRQQDRDTAPTRSEQIEQTDARIAQVEARVERLLSQREDHILRAPFSGVVTVVDAVAGETVSGSPILTLLGDTEAYEVRARIPEVDITKVETGQAARVYFDASPQEPLGAEVTYLSPVPESIDGVAYFEARLHLSDQPSWMRVGLNADVAIITDQRTEAVRVPAGLIDRSGARPTVHVRTNDSVTPTPVTILFTGSDGFVAVDGLRAGERIVAP